MYPQTPSAATAFATEEFQFHPVSSLKIPKIVHSFPSNKAPELDKVPMKDALNCILFTLTEIVNHSLLTFIIPMTGKEAFVIPLLKEEDHKVSNNSRLCSYCLHFPKSANEPPVTSLLDTWSERRACPNIRVETKNYTQTSLQQA